MNIIKRICQFVLLLATQQSVAQPTALDFQAAPPLLAANAKPLVMLVLSNDHELFKKAYSDYSDINGDAIIDSSYNDNIDYYGYFNSNKCYRYQTSALRFEPANNVLSGSHRCDVDSARWSGNFLNWASMTRIDIVRKILYGGKRSIDTASQTVLERALIPNDVHAFVKVFSGAVADYTPFNSDSISLCNTSLYNPDAGGSAVSGSLQTAAHPPLLRIAQGRFPQWATAEVRQCLFDGEGVGSSSGSRPRQNLALNTGGSGGGAIINGSYVAKVSVCVNEQDANAEYCRAYGTANNSIKPAGLLQQHGESNAIRFGLLTGSYNKNTEGGVLRKNISQFAGGNSLVDNEVDLSTGMFIGNSNSIVRTLDSLRIASWDFLTVRYSDCDRFGIAISTFKSASANENRQCRDWGNPLSEIYLEALRYFAGTPASTPAFSSDNFVAGVNQAPWLASATLTPDNACAECAIVVLSTGLNSFDADDLASAADLPLADTVLGFNGVSQSTKQVGLLEGIAGNSQIIVGNADNTTSSNRCSSKTLGINGLAGVKGLCPEIPQLEGSYHIAGLSFYGKNADLRADLAGKQDVNTYTIALAETLPSFSVSAQDASGQISFVPACQANTNGRANLNTAGWTDCSLSDVTVVQQTHNYAHILIAWEDSYWGNDYDMDGIASIEYCRQTGSASTVRAACPKYSNNGSAPDWSAATSGEIQIRVSVPVAAAGNALRFGFIMNGSIANDGSIIELLRPGGETINRLNGQTTRTIRWDVVRKFRTSASASNSASNFLQNPLWYAAKYGKFNDRNGSNTPDLQIEWDNKDVFGNPTPDGLPDNYFPISNPAQLATALRQVFNDIDSKLVSSSAAAVVANASNGSGAVFQGLYYPKFQLDSGAAVNWVGMLQGIFRDGDGNLREDTNQNASLDDYTTDYKIELFFDSDPNVEATRIRRFSSVDAGISFNLLDEIDLEDFKPIWNARDELAKIANTAVAQQRDYNQTAAVGRYIFTGIDQNGDSKVEHNETFAFDSAHFTDDVGNSNFRYLGLQNNTRSEVTSLINFIRGEEGLSNYRSRAIDFDGDGTNEVWRLGDIIHSEPVSVARPNASFDSRYGDQTYKRFRQQYAKRRQVIYVGANDGMLHAFNAGFYDANTQRFNTDDGGSAVAHPLGSELWAYLPMNLLPHLRWLTDPDYQHVYYMDGSPRVFDVNIFTSDDDHPDGWGTILVTGMRSGGSPISVDPDSDVDNNSDDDIVHRSGFVIMDITNPEKPPVLLSELFYIEGSIAAIQVSNGGRYGTAPQVVINGDGSGASAIAVLADEGFVSINCAVGKCGSGYQLGDVLRVSDAVGNTVGEFFIRKVEANGKIKLRTNAGFDAPAIVDQPLFINAEQVGDGNAQFTIRIKYPISNIQLINPGKNYTNASIELAGNASAQATLFSATDFGFSTAKPVVVKQRRANDAGAFDDLSVSGNNSWLLLLGSGPRGDAALNQFESNRPASVLMYDLITQKFIAGFRPDVNATGDDDDYSLVSHPNSFAGDFAAVDWDDDYSDDAVYFGVVSGSAANPGGALKRLDLDFVNPLNTSLSTLLETDNPIVNAPRLIKDTLNNRWVYAGTGRYLSTDDSLSQKSQFFYGLIDDGSDLPLSTNDLIDVSNLQVFTQNPDDSATLNFVRQCAAPCSNGGGDANVNGVDIQTWQDLRSEIIKTKGWYRAIDLHRELALAGTNSSAARALGATNRVGPTLLFVEYAPSPDQCAPIGFSRRKAVHFQTGTASPFARSGLGGSFTYNDIELNFVQTDDGTVNSVLLLGGDGQGHHDNADGDGTTGSDKGELDDKKLNSIPYASGRQGWQEIDISWDIGF